MLYARDRGRKDSGQERFFKMLDRGKKRSLFTREKIVVRGRVLVKNKIKLKKTLFCLEQEIDWYGKKQFPMKDCTGYSGSCSVTLPPFCCLLSVGVGHNLVSLSSGKGLSGSREALIFTPLVAAGCANSSDELFLWFQGRKSVSLIWKFCYNFSRPLPS